MMMNRTMFAPALALVALASCASGSSEETSQSRSALTAVAADAGVANGGSAAGSSGSSSSTTTGSGGGSSSATTGSGGSSSATTSSGSGSSGAPAPAPTSTISVTYDDGNPTSQFPFPPSMTWTCNIPQGVLSTLPIYNGNPVMKSCTISVVGSGNPPTSVSTNLYCTDLSGGAYNYFNCSSSFSLVPPSFTQSGYFSYGAAGAGTPNLPDATCSAYIDRALGICNSTGAAAGP